MLFTVQKKVIFRYKMHTRIRISVKWVSLCAIYILFFSGNVLKLKILFIPNKCKLNQNEKDYETKNVTEYSKPLQNDY